MALLECEDLCLGYSTPQGWKPVVNQVSFHIESGQTVALVGESGSGKSTIAKSIVKLIPVQDGDIRFKGQAISAMDTKEFHPFRKHIQLVFQDPWQALNPRLNAEQLLTEPLNLHFSLSTKERNKRIDELLDCVHLPTTIRDRYSSELSGGQRQRLLIARAIAVGPELLICDEPVSALDVSIQAQLLELLDELKQTRGLTILFISHDLAVVQKMADQVLVLIKGQAVEWKSSQDLFRHPEHAYTRSLIDACPKW